MTETLIKSPMNYTCGKYKLLKQILPLFPNNTNFKGKFIDLFCGGCNVGINVNAKQIIFNDLDKNVIDIYNSFNILTIDGILKHIEKRITEYQLSITNKEGYDKFREYYNKCLDKSPLDLFVLICFSFNHQIRFNKKGEFNMPFGKKRSRWNDSIMKNLINFKQKLHNSNISFTNFSFDEMKIDKLTNEDFVYCDPPYLITCATYNEKDGWNETQERKLLEMLDDINKRKVSFALSNVLTNKGKENKILIEWSQKYNVHFLENSYANCNYHTKDKNTKPTEVLITNY